MKIKRALSTLLLMAPLVSAQAGMVVTLSDNGSGFTTVNIRGTGTTELAYYNQPGRVSWIVSGGLQGDHPDSYIKGGAFPAVDHTHDLGSLDFIGNSRLTGITFAEEGLDDFRFLLEPGASIDLGEVIDIDYTFDTLAAFSSFNTGTYTPRSEQYGEPQVYGDFQVIVEPVSAPSAAALFGLGLLGLGFARRKSL